MPLEMNDTVAVLSGHADITEAEPLLAFLAEADAPAVDVSDCPSAHAAVLQVILSAHPRLIGAEDHPDWRALLTGGLRPAAAVSNGTASDASTEAPSMESQTL